MDKLKDPKHIVSFSGGKDSTCMLLLMIEKGMQIDEVIFADTQYEFDEIYDYIDKIEQIIGMEITRTKPIHTFLSWFYGTPQRGKHKLIRGFPLTAFGCWWSRDAKFVPLIKAIGNGNIVYIGIASDEKHRTKSKAYIDKPNNYRFPLVEWNMTEKECQEYLDKRGLRNPLSDRFNRTGCWWCPKQSMKSLRSLYKYYPAKWEQLKQWDKDAPNGFRPDTNLLDLEKRFEQENKQGDFFNE